MTAGSLTDLEVAAHYPEALHEVIAAKAETGPRSPPRAGRGRAAPVVDLMAALEESVADARERRGETAGGEATVHEMPKAKMAAANKAMAKRPRRRSRRPAGRPPDAHGRGLRAPPGVDPLWGY
ncbi:hypothetical protein [Streptomyces venezuelae]|uniref:hypothetical protein n=1 Tax=Streptomyces venezuelae TaxID=54571 RepID=UPI00123E149B|nr:hypothetical protein [Streptomyces venezuelae]